MDRLRTWLTAVHQTVMTKARDAIANTLGIRKKITKIILAASSPVSSSNFPHAHPLHCPLPNTNPNPHHCALPKTNPIPQFYHVPTIGLNTFFSKCKNKIQIYYKNLCCERNVSQMKESILKINCIKKKEICTNEEIYVWLKMNKESLLHSHLLILPMQKHVQY